MVHTTPVYLYFWRSHVDSYALLIPTSCKDLQCLLWNGQRLKHTYNNTWTLKRRKNTQTCNYRVSGMLPQIREVSLLEVCIKLFFEFHGIHESRNVRSDCRVYAPRFLYHHTKDLEWRTLKPSACHSSQVLDRPCYSSQVSNGPC